jgi:hypothetical protein
MDSGLRTVIFATARAFAVLGWLAIAFAGSVTAAGDLDEPLARVEHHLRLAQPLTEHFEAVVSQDCPRFATSAEWRRYVDAEIDLLILMVAHLDEAWAEARRTGDDDVRRTAKAPRRRKDEARAALEKVQRCAADNGASFSTFAVVRKIERELPSRRATIALPQ